MDEIVSLKYVVNALLFSGIGLVVFVAAFILLEAVTPKVNIWKELVEKQNIAVAILMGSFILGTATIIASAIHG